MVAGALDTYDRLAEEIARAEPSRGTFVPLRDQTTPSTIGSCVLAS